MNFFAQYKFFFNKLNIVPLIILGLIIAYGSFGRWVVVNNTVVDQPIRADAADYFFYAKNLSLSSTFSKERVSEEELTKDALRPPGFPAFASLFYQGDNITSVSSVLKAQTIIQSLSFLLLSILCWWSFGAWASVLISLLVWTHPAFMSINTYYLTESLFLSSLILVLVSFALTIKYQFGLKSMIFLGLVVGLSALIRPTMEYYFLFLIPILFFKSHTYFKKYFPALITFFCIVVFWKIRNYVAIGEFSDPSLMVNGLLHGSYPNFMYNGDVASYGFPYRFDPDAEQAYEGVSKTLEMIWHRAYEQPGQYLLWYFIGKQFFLWQWDILAGAGDVFIYPTVLSPITYQFDLKFFHDVHRIINAPIMFVGVISSYVVVTRNFIKKMSVDIDFVIASLVVYASLFHIVVAPFPRYGIAFKVLVLIAFIRLGQVTLIKLKKRME